jgi:hypothetical protein
LYLADRPLFAKGKPLVNRNKRRRSPLSKNIALIGKMVRQGDDDRTFLGDFVTSLPQFNFSGALNI